MMYFIDLRTTLMIDEIAGFALEANNLSGSLASAHLGVHVLHLLALGVGTLVRAQPHLGELVNALLVRHQAADLTDNLTHELHTLAEFPLAGRRALGNLALLHSVPLVRTNSNSPC